MQRIRQSLPYFRQFDWDPVVIAVDEAYCGAYSKDDLLLKTIPCDIKIHKVKALPLKFTRHIGLGSLSLRSYFQIKKKGDELLKKEKFDLVYFSTTAFHVLPLGKRWKKKFAVPFIIDLQDPWRNDFYQNDAFARNNLKFFLYHNLDRYLEAKTLPYTDGIISVSPGYVKMYQQRYPGLIQNKFCVIPFGFATSDFVIARQCISSSANVPLFSRKKNMVYIGRGGNDMQYAVEIIFDAIKKGRELENPIFNNIQLWFVGTDYAASGTGTKTIEPIAVKKGIKNIVVEIPDRIPYFETLHLLLKADVLMVPGSTDETYTASKIYPYLFSNKPMLAVFHEKSSVCKIISETSKAKVVAFNQQLTESERNQKVMECFLYLKEVFTNKITTSEVNMEGLEKYSALEATRQQTEFFDKIIRSLEKTPASYA